MYVNLELSLQVHFDQKILRFIYVKQKLELYQRSMQTYRTNLILGALKAGFAGHTDSQQPTALS